GRRAGDPSRLRDPTGRSDRSGRAARQRQRRGAAVSRNAGEHRGAGSRAGPAPDGKRGPAGTAAAADQARSPRAQPPETRDARAARGELMDQDVIHRFSFADAPIRGQWVRLSGSLEEAFQRQRYPVPARRLLAEMLAAVSLMADNVKLPGTVALQSRGNGPISTALAECRDRHLLRGLVRWREEAPEDGPGEAGRLDSEPALANL